MTLLAEIALLIVASIGIAVSVSRLPAPRPKSRRGAAANDRLRPEQLVALERLVSTAGGSAAQVHAYLRPLLIQIASHRLTARGVTLERMPDSVGRELFGPPLWDIVRPDRSFPEDRHGPGVPPHELGTMLDVLERL